MTKAEYLGYKCDRLKTNKVYPITTHCVGNTLVVRCKDNMFRYANLEGFLKEWKVRAVYREQGRKA